MRKYKLIPDFVVKYSADGNRQTQIKIDEDSSEYQVVKIETNNFTENMYYPLTETEQRIADLELAIVSILGGA